MLIFPETEQRIKTLGKAIQQCCTLYKNSEVLGVCTTLAVRTAARTDISKEKFLELLSLMWEDEQKRAADRKLVKVDNGTETDSPGQRLVRPS